MFEFAAVLIEYTHISINCRKIYVAEVNYAVMRKSYFDRKTICGAGGANSIFLVEPSNPQVALQMECKIRMRFMGLGGRNLSIVYLCGEAAPRGLIGNVILSD